MTLLLFQAYFPIARQSNITAPWTVQIIPNTQFSVALLLSRYYMLDDRQETELIIESKIILYSNEREREREILSVTFSFLLLDLLYNYYSLFTLLQCVCAYHRITYINVSISWERKKIIYFLTFKFLIIVCMLEGKSDTFRCIYHPKLARLSRYFFFFYVIRIWYIHWILVILQSRNNIALATIWSRY